MEEDIKNMSKEELLEYLEDISQQLDNIALDQIQFAISELQFFKDEYKKLKKEVESQDKTIDKLVEEQEEREKYVHSLEEENAKLRIDNTDKLCEECSELVKQAGITKEDTNRILKEYRDRIENSIPTSVIQKKIEEVNNSNGYSPVNKIFIEKVLNEILKEGRR